MDQQFNNEINLNNPPHSIPKINQVDGTSDEIQSQDQEKSDSLSQKLILEMMNYKKQHQNDSNGWYDVTITKSLKHLVTDYIIKTPSSEVINKKKNFY